MKKLFSSAFSAIKKSTMFIALFCMSIVANAATYALYGNVPEGATDLTANVSAQALGSATFVDGVFTGAGLPGRICESSNYLQMTFLAQQTMDLSEDLAIHIVVAKAAGAAGDLQLAFCNNGWNAARLGYIIPNASINETATDIVLNYKDYNPDNWNSYEMPKFVGTPVTFPAAEFLRVCAANAEAFTISSIYVTTESAGNTEPEQPVVIPDQDPQRIYLRKGTAVTPAGVAETADYTATTSVSSEWWNCTPSDAFFGVATQENWWFNFQLKSSTDVDLTPVYSTWKLVISIKNGVVEEGQDRGLTINLAGANLNLVSTFAQATAFTQHILPLADVLTGANNLKLLSAGTTVIDFSSGNNNAAGRNVEFDYIYLTNEADVPTVPTAIDTVESQLNAQKVVRNGQVYILRGEKMFDLTGRQVQ